MPERGLPPSLPWPARRATKAGSPNGSGTGALPRRGKAPSPRFDRVGSKSRRNLEAARKKTRRCLRVSPPVACCGSTRDGGAPVQKPSETRLARGWEGGRERGLRGGEAQRLRGSGLAYQGSKSRTMFTAWRAPLHQTVHAGCLLRPQLCCTSCTNSRSPNSRGPDVSVGGP